MERRGVQATCQHGTIMQGRRDHIRDHAESLCPVPRTHEVGARGLPAREPGRLAVPRKPTETLFRGPEITA